MANEAITERRAHVLCIVPPLRRGDGKLRLSTPCAPRLDPDHDYPEDARTAATDDDEPITPFSRLVFGPAPLRMDGRPDAALDLPGHQHGDSGPGSLRQAILDSNAADRATNTIDFDISGSGVQTIAPLSSLPAITNPVLIDGFSQPGTPARP